MRTTQAFSKQLCKLVANFNKWGADSAKEKFFFDEMAINFNVLVDVMLYEIMHNANSNFNVTVKTHGSMDRETKLKYETLQP